LNAQATVQAYKESSVLTAPPEQLVLMLYDGALRFIARASIAMREQGPVAAAEPIKRAQAIVEELLSALDHDAGGEIADRLQAIYVYCLRLLPEAQLHADVERLEQVASMLRELREAWAEICRR
jgi:flagellar protein FliS